ncbi:MAG: DUF5123 domain-containing protein [Bacteroidales bacterium]|jgi:hypothetical protein|nr:DUF5123 domain-containing protein [Bacteroidales bacterium]HNX84801.1 DUF5123 domain-containing protein [Bacteroidales bacterium]HPS98348.1 DUF5123 domain-containing protein [Bacteroidales bacterium]
MKKIIIKTGLFAGLITLLLFTSCKEQIDPVVEELDFSRAFSPVGIEAVISNTTTVTLTWSSVKNTDHYLLEIYDGATATSTLVHSAEVPATEDSQVSYTYVLPAGDTQFFGRIKAVSSLQGIDESKWSLVAFKTDPENLFQGYDTYMSAMNACIVQWEPEATATSLLFVSGGTQVPVTLSAEDLALGGRQVTGLANGVYEVRLMNGNFVRGRTHVIIEGDVLVEPGGDLKAALDALPAGGVILLVNGVSYSLPEVDTVRTSTKVRGILPHDLPKIFLATGGGNHMFDIGTAMTLSDSLVFENVDISCAYDDGDTKHRGVIDQEGDAFSIGAIKFRNCIIRNSGRSAIRLRGNAAGQVINNVEFLNCVMYDFAFDSHYGVLNGAATGNFINIKFLNCTVNKLRGGIINYGNGAGCQSVVIDNCTFNETTMDTGSSRYFIDFGTSNTSTGTLAISDCIFGQTVDRANGVRPGSMVMTVTGSYYTSDFYDVAGPVKNLMTAYSGASTALWTDPVGGNFTFLDANFEGIGLAGAPRWAD